MYANDFYITCLYAIMQLHVISVWLQHPWAGLGDLIRGTMHLHDLSQRLNFKFTIDTQFHPISKCLTESECSDPEQSQYVLQNKNKVHDFVNGDITELSNLIVNAMNTNRMEPLLISNNLTEKMFVALNNPSALFIRKFLEPTTAFKTILNQMCKRHKISKNYSIIHFRLGDDELVKHHRNIAKYNRLLRIIDSNMSENTYIISDSHEFKNFLRQVRPQLSNNVISTKPIHLSHSTENDSEKVIDTLFDFFLLTNAKLIKTYTNYTWVSGFVMWVSLAFGVPYINLNLNSNPNVKTTHQTTMYNQQMQPQFTFSKARMTNARKEKPMLFLNK
jgi:hypothetical protein